MPPKKTINKKEFDKYIRNKLNHTKEKKLYGPTGKKWKPKPITAKEVKELYKKLINNKN